MKCSCSIDTCDDGSGVVLTHKITKARKQHRCGECGDDINPGDKYERYCGIGDDGLFGAKTCLLCVEVRDCFCCSWYFGEVWNSIQGYVWDIDLHSLGVISKPARDKFFGIVNIHELDE